MIALSAHCGEDLGHGGNRWHVWLRALARHLVLYLQLVEALALVRQGVRVACATPIAIVELTVVRGAGWRVLLGVGVAAVRVFARVVVGIVDEALFLEEVFAASFARFVNLLAVLAKSVILDVDLAALRQASVRLRPLVVYLLLAGALVHVLLHHADEAQKLAALHLLWVEVVSFRYVEMGNDIVGSLGGEHIGVKEDVVIELLVVPLLKVVDNGHLGRIVLDHELGGHGWHQRATQ